METACYRGIRTATAFGDVAAQKRNETASSGRLGAESAAAGRRKGGALTDSGTRHTSASCYVATGQKSSLSHPDFDVAAKIGSPTSTRLGEGVQRTEIQESTIEDRGTRHQKPPNRSLTRCQTADRPR
jgi:hypothetical protein